AYSASKAAQLSLAEAARAEAAKLAIREKLTEQAAYVSRIEGARQAAGITGSARQRMDAKLDILSRFQQFRARLPYKGTVARAEFCRAYNGHTIEVPDWVLKLYPDVSEGSIFRWEKAIQSRGLAALAGGYGNRRGTGTIDQTPEYREFVLSMLHDFPRCRPDQISAGMAARFGSTGREIPSIKAIDYWVSTWKKNNQDVYLKMLSPDKFNSRARVAVGDADENIFRLNQLWETDTTPGDVMCQDGRASIIGMLDVFTRRAKLLVCKSSTAVMVAALIRRSILDWGIPESIRTDNGSDYTSNHVQRVLAGLAVEQIICPPFQPWKKPFIERFFRTFSHDLLELMPQ
ncbi:MAG TPA: transposase family protein, partial [Candidatus Ozemobacteraceae bacterium]|nr:transposase family protein [Candidatus Ozemobacteraceae bacterium]